MNSSSNSKAFIFNDEINAESINALYGDDYLYIQEVFDTVLKEYVLLANNIMACYSSKDIPALKAAVHKIKPIFGFVGLIDVQEQCQSFEHVCQHASSFDLIDSDYGPLKNKIVWSKSLIEEEKKKLELYNSQAS
jgi:Hpt domain